MLILHLQVWLTNRSMYIDRYSHPCLTQATLVDAFSQQFVSSLDDCARFDPNAHIPAQLHLAKVVFWACC
jgi:hypothetical protein